MMSWHEQMRYVNRFFTLRKPLNEQQSCKIKAFAVHLTTTLLEIKSTSDSALFTPQGISS